MAKLAFFKRRRQPVADRDWSDAHLINVAIDIHHDDSEFGYRLGTDELAEAGIVAGRKRVDRLCTSQRLWPVLAQTLPPVAPGRRSSTTSSSESSTQLGLAGSG